MGKRTSNQSGRAVHGTVNAHSVLKICFHLSSGRPLLILSSFDNGRRHEPYFSSKASIILSMRIPVIFRCYCVKWRRYLAVDKPIIPPARIRIWPWPDDDDNGANFICDLTLTTDIVFVLTSYSPTQTYRGKSEDG